MKNQTICFIGHRCCKDNIVIRKSIKMVIIELIINKGVRFFWSRGARGFDTIASMYF